MAEPAGAEPDSKIRDWDFPSLSARRGGASPLKGVGPGGSVTAATDSPTTAASLSLSFSLSFSFSCSFFSLSFSTFAASRSGRMRSAMEVFLVRPSWLVSDFRPRLFFRAKNSPSFFLRVREGAGQGAALVGATSCSDTGTSSSCCFRASSAGRTLFVKNSSTPSSTLPMSSGTSCSLSNTGSCGLDGRWLWFCRCGRGRLRV